MTREALSKSDWDVWGIRDLSLYAAVFVSGSITIAQPESVDV